MNKNEDVISMVIGLGVVIVIAMVIVNFVIRNKGNISLPGLSVVNKQLPLTTPTDSLEVGSNNYEVQKGDSLWKISENMYGVGYKWTEIAKANKLQNASIIEVGQKLVLPEISKVSADVKVESKSITYTVKFNDSLWKIAISEYGDGNNWVQIWDLNKNIISNPNVLEVGMILKLR